MKICVTGKKGSGKSTFIKYLESINIVCYKADDYIHEIYKENKIGFNFILKEFGNEYIFDNKVNRKKLNELILNDKKALKKLNSFSVKTLIDWIKSLPNDCFIELGIYLNNSKKFKILFDKVILIKKENLKIDKNHISNILKVDKKTKFDYELENNNSIEDFYKSISLFYMSYKQ